MKKQAMMLAKILSFLIMFSLFRGQSALHISLAEATVSDLILSDLAVSKQIYMPKPKTSSDNLKPLLQFNRTITASNSLPSPSVPETAEGALYVAPDLQEAIKPDGDSPVVVSNRSDTAILYFSKPITFTPIFTTYLPIVSSPFNLKNLVTKTTFILPEPLAETSGSWCTWGYCSLSPRLYHEPLSDGHILVGWTGVSGSGHVNLLSNNGELDQTYNFPDHSVQGLVAHEDDTFAILLWDAEAKIMWLSKFATNGDEIWTTNIDGSLTSFDSRIGDSRLAYGNDLYAAYFAVYGDTGWPAGHNGDQLTYVSSDGVIQAGGWEWGCSHSLAALVSYHPTLNTFAPICASDCYASKGILLNNRHIVFQCDGNCAALVSAQLGQIALSNNSWKLIFNALDRPDYVGKGIGLATIDGSFQSRHVWLTNTNGAYERDPVIARLGSNLQTDRYLVGWRTINDDVYWLGVINGNGNFLAGPEEVSSAEVAWGNRDDSFRTHTDGRVTWIQGNPSSMTLHLYRFNGSIYLP